MSLTSGMFNEGEQMGEKLTDHAVPHIIDIIQAIFDRLWQTRIVIDIGRREMPKEKQQ